MLMRFIAVFFLILGITTGALVMGNVFFSAGDYAVIKTQTPSPAPTGTFVPSSQETASNNPPIPAPSEVSLAKLSCGSDTGAFQCYENHYRELIEGAGAAAAVADLKARYAADAYAKAQCHSLMHVIGRIAAEQFSTVGEAYKYGDSFCWSGYYHGVLESFAARVGLNDLRAKLNDVCADIPGKERYSFDYYNCVHGLGHGIMALTNTELFESLSYCDSLAGAWEQVSCASGAYMENVIVDGLNHVTKYLKPDDPLYPCNASPEKYKQTCYLMQTSYMLKINGGDFAKTFEWCRGAEEGQQNTCYLSLGRDASGRSASNVARTKAMCDLGTTVDEKTYCALGAVKDFISYFHSDVQGKTFCNTFEEEAIRDRCLAEAATYYSFF